MVWSAWLKRLTAVCLMMLAYGGPFPALAEEIVAVTEVWPPFRIADPKNPRQFTGIDVDLLEALSQRMGVPYRIVQLPWARCLDFMKTGEADLITGLAHTPERAEYIRYSDISYYRVSPAFFVRKGRADAIKTYDDLRRFSIGYSINSAYFEPFNSDTGLRKIGVSTEKQLIQMLAGDRLDVIIGTDCNVAHDLVRMGLTDRIEQTYYRPDAHTDLYVGISKKSKRMDRWEALNRTLEELVRSGAVTRMADKYLKLERLSP